MSKREDAIYTGPAISPVDTMTARENMLAVFRHEIPEWIPVHAHCDPYNQPGRQDMDPELAEAMPEVKWGDGSSAIFSRYLGLDVMDFFGPLGFGVIGRDSQFI